MIKSPLFYVYVGWSCGLGFMAAQEFWLFVTGMAGLCHG